MFKDLSYDWFVQPLGPIFFITFAPASRGVIRHLRSEPSPGGSRRGRLFLSVTGPPRAGLFGTRCLDRSFVQRLVLTGSPSSGPLFFINFGSASRGVFRYFSGLGKTRGGSLDIGHQSPVVRFSISEKKFFFEKFSKSSFSKIF